MDHVAIMKKLWGLTGKILKGTKKKNQDGVRSNVDRGMR